MLGVLALDRNCEVTFPLSPRAPALVLFVSDCNLIWADTNASRPAPAAALSKERVTREGRKAWPLTVICRGPE